MESTFRYTPPVSIRAFVGMAFVLNLLLSNVCLVGTAYAATPSDDPILSREVPMSFNVVTCTWIKTDEGWQPTPDSPCASGECLKKQKPDTRCLTANIVELPAASIPIATSYPAFRQASQPIAAIVTESPPPYPGHGSTVLRM